MTRRDFAPLADRVLRILSRNLQVCGKTLIGKQAGLSKISTMGQLFAPPAAGALQPLGTTEIGCADSSSAKELSKSAQPLPSITQNQVSLDKVSGAHSVGVGNQEDSDGLELQRSRPGLHVGSAQSVLSMPRLFHAQ